MNKLKIKYPFVYGKFATGTAGLEELRWLLDNVHLIKDEKTEVHGYKSVGVDRTGKIRSLFFIINMAGSFSGWLFYYLRSSTLYKPYKNHSASVTAPCEPIAQSTTLIAPSTILVTCLSIA